MDFTKEDILGYECKHATFRKNGNNDILVVKEVIHLKDKRRIPNVRIVPNYKRDLWMTREGFRNHKDKKEWEFANRLEKFTTNQARLPEKIAQILGRAGTKLPLRTWAENPYLYGFDISTPALIKRDYMERYKLFSPNTVAVLDIETDVVNGTGDVIAISLTFKDKVFLATTKAFIGTMVNPTEKVSDAFQQHLGDYIHGKGDDPKDKSYIPARNCKLEFVICETPGEACARTIEKAHEWKTDFVSIWNINFDLPIILRTLEKEKYDIGELFSDQKVPEGYRTARYIEGQAIKVTADGREFSKNPVDRWHTMDAPASFYFVDAMSTYKGLRVASGNESSYRLDDVLHKHLGLRKLKFDDILEREAPHITAGSLPWHVFMQKLYKIEYLIYNIFDCVSVELLDEKTGDLMSAFPTLIGFSEYRHFPSQPRTLVDDLHFECLDNGRVIGTTANEMVNEIDHHTYGLKNWIVTLPSYSVVENGLTCIEEMPNHHTYVYSHVADLDMRATYPTETVIFNVSKETTENELCRFNGIPEMVGRYAGINYTGGKTNAYEICRALHNAPALEDVLKVFKEQHSLA